MCFVTKAIHLEIVTDLTSKAFISALQRFISRRGYCEEIYSDNGTNFVGSHNELSELYKLFQNTTDKSRINDFCSTKHIKWNFIPARSPHFGGLWEAGIK